MLKWVRGRLKLLEESDLCGFIFKSRSPSSGIGGVTVYTSAGMPGRKGAGLFGGAFTKAFPLIPVIDDGRLHDPQLRENFIERVFVYRRWKEFLMEGASLNDLVAFHTKHKLLILSHSPKHLTILGRIVADAKNHALVETLSRYITVLTEALRLLATTKKHTNVMHHIIGYFKKHLSPDEKKEMLDLIDAYHKGYVPLIVPVVLINHYVKKFDEPYLKKQHYLNPHPIELMLRNHV
jgi:uncharacterized protein YbgA (DUF1722 family)